ncbi:hypothetical protein IC762_34970 [Bradyrhizobium genosp. L]|uniref:hypothetical protein n=1 Tax=Bradyrhizobium genosp. L TaxID=83637 RepID=UPI0018A256A1|nr:hypothetical protein [Bradyrhizobium genosp. L]QPF84732.1 hypothetical protein IC762_34970 [Bradyrhizobium genosp. L]
MIDFDELRDLAADVRIFIEASDDKASALKAVVEAYDVVLGIFPAQGGPDLHVIKGSEILNYIARSQTDADYSHTAIAFQSRDQAVALQQALAA